VRWLSRALELTPESEWRERYELLLALDRVLKLTGQVEGARQTVAELQALVVRLDAEDRAEVAVRQADLAMDMGLPSEAIAAALEAVEQARLAGRPDLESAARIIWGMVLVRLQPAADRSPLAAAQVQVEEALALARAAGLVPGEARALFALSLIRHRHGDFFQERAYLEAALGLSRAAGDRLAEAQIAYRMSGSWLYTGDYARSRAWAEQSLALAREIGWRLAEATALCQLGQICWVLGDYRRARPYLEQALTMSRELPSSLEQVYVLFSLIAWRHRVEDGAGAVEYGEQALRLALDTGSGEAEAEAHYALGEAYLGTGEPAVAREHYEQALRICRQLVLPPAHLVRARAGVARAALAQGDLPAAQAQVEETLLAFLEGDSAFGYPEPGPIYLSCYRVLRAAGDPRAAEVLDTAYHALRELAARAPDQTLGRSFLENVAENREIVEEWERRGAREGEGRMRR
jgi:tetratricopeptide (TPR) repeat protein